MNLAKLPTLISRKYSWCGLGAIDPVTKRPWHRIRTTFTSLGFPRLFAGWAKDEFRPSCCAHATVKQPTRHRFRKEDALDRNKASREYPDCIAKEIVTDIQNIAKARARLADEKFGQSKKDVKLPPIQEYQSVATTKTTTTTSKKKKHAKKIPIVYDTAEEISGDCGEDFAPVWEDGEDMPAVDAKYIIYNVTTTIFMAQLELQYVQDDWLCSLDDAIQQEYWAPKPVFFDDLNDFVDFYRESANDRVTSCELRLSRDGRERLAVQVCLDPPRYFWQAEISFRSDDDLHLLIWFLEQIQAPCIVLNTPRTDEMDYDRLHFVYDYLWQVTHAQHERQSVFVMEVPCEPQFDDLPWIRFSKTLSAQGVYLQLGEPLLVIANHDDAIKALADLDPCFTERPEASDLGVRYGQKLNELVKHFSAFPTQEQFSKAKCKACRGRKRKGHAAHTRVRDECLYPDDEDDGRDDVWEQEFSCPSCQAKYGRFDPGHTYREGECRWAIEAMAQRTTRAEAQNVVPRARTRTPAPIIPVPGRGSPGDPAAEAGHAETDPLPDPAAARSSPARTEAEALEEDRRIAGDAAEAAAAAQIAVDHGADAAVGDDEELVFSDEDPDDPNVPQAARAPRAKKKVDAGTQATDPWNTPDWSGFDLGRALQLLKNGKPDVVRRIIQRLHIRNYHQSAEQLVQLLQAAGAPKSALDLVHPIVKACKICNMWLRPQARSIATGRLTTRFNEIIQCDLLFVFTLAVLHIVDEATRWSAVQVLKSRSEEDLCDGFNNGWIKIWGPPRVLIIDQESGFAYDYGQVFCERLGIDRKLRGKDQHAHLVERHHEILRQHAHRLKIQCDREGLRITEEQIVNESCFAKNALLTIGRTTPYKSVVGETPNLLQEFEAPTVSQREDPDHLRRARVREISLATMIEVTAGERIKRSLDSQSRPAGETFDYKNGDLVDVYRKPLNKDISGWRGPAKVVDASPESLHDGVIHTRWGGRVLINRLQDVRRHVAFYLLFYSAFGLEWRPLVNFTAAIGRTTLLVGWVFAETGWTISRGAQVHPRLYAHILLVASMCLGLHDCVGARFGSGVSVAAGLVGMSYSLIVYWLPGQAVYETIEWDGSARLPLTMLLGDRWHDYHWIQFLTVREEAIRDIRRVVMRPPERPQPPKTVDDKDKIMDQRMLPPPSPSSSFEEDDPPAGLPPRPPPPPPPPERGRSLEPRRVVDGPREPPVLNLGQRVRQTSEATRSRSTMSKMSSIPEERPLDAEDGPLLPLRQTPRGSRSRSRGEPSTPPISNRPTSTTSPGIKPSVKDVSRSRSRDRNAASSSVTPPGTVILPIATPDEASGVLPASMPAVPQSPSLASTTPYEDDVAVSVNTDTTVATVPYGDEEPDVTLPVEEPTGADTDEYYTAHDDMVYQWWDSISAWCTRYQIDPRDFFEVSTCAREADTELLDRENDLEVEFEDDVTQYMTHLPGKMRQQSRRDGGSVVARYSKTKNVWSYFIDRETHTLSKEEEKFYHKEVIAGKLKELQAWVDLEAFELIPRSKGKNIMTGRWVLRWKFVDGHKVVKARLVIRGFQDRQQSELDTASFTARRTSQRIVVSTAVQYDWRLFSWDIGNAFLRGLTFQELEEEGETLREACIDPPADVYTILGTIDGFRGGSKISHLLRLLKGGYGLKDAPRLWKRKLERFLRARHGQQSMWDSCIWLWFKDGRLVLILSTHIDDLKGAGEPVVARDLYEALTKEFQKITKNETKFEHCGIMHCQNEDGSVTMTQDHYIKDLKPIPLTKEQRQNEMDTVDDTLHAQYLALQGGLGWTVNTRHDVAVYIGALQRRQKAPRVLDVIRLNQVLKFVKKRKCYLLFKKLTAPLKVLLISDSAFRRIGQDCLACRGHIVALAELCELQPGGKFHPLDVISRRHKRVNRSTFSAEVNGLADGLEPAKVIALQYDELIRGVATAATMAQVARQGLWALPIEAVIDAFGVFQALMAKDAKLPLEESLIAIVMTVREQFSRGLLKRLWWCCTQDMLADALTKGAVKREPLLEALNNGAWVLLQECKSATLEKDCTPARDDINLDDELQDRMAFDMLESEM